MMKNVKFHIYDNIQCVVTKYVPTHCIFLVNYAV